MIPAIMEIKLNMAGKDLTFSSLAEITSWLLELQNESPKPRATNGAAGHSDHAALEDADAEVVERSLRALKVIRKYSPREANSERMMMALRAGSPKGVGARSVAVNKLLNNLGFRKGSVYRSVKKPLEPRLWIAGANIDKAIAILSKEYEALKESGALQ